MKTNQKKLQENIQLDSCSLIKKLVGGRKKNKKNKKNKKTKKIKKYRLITKKRKPQVGDQPTIEAQNRSTLPIGSIVYVIQKQDQPTGKKTIGIVAQHLTRISKHPRGIKVRLTNNIVGRVVSVIHI